MSETDERRAEAVRWLQYATEDLELGESLAADGIFASRYACWQFQQAADNALKAALVLDGIAFSYARDLNGLCALVPDSWFLGEERPDLSYMAEWAVETRYPGQWTERTAEDARRAGADAPFLPHSLTVGTLAPITTRAIADRLIPSARIFTACEFCLSVNRCFAPS